MFGFFFGRVMAYVGKKKDARRAVCKLAYEYLEHYESKEAYIQEVSQLNSIRNGKIISGQNLIMPYYSTEYKL